MKPWLALTVGSVLVAASACRDDAMSTIRDAATPRDGAAVDAMSPVGVNDGGPALRWVELAVSGCANTPPPGSGDPAGANDTGVPVVCTGRAPLTLRFTAVASAAVTIYEWDFGDGMRSQEPSPTHVYELPGRYSVRLTVAGAGGTAGLDKTDFISVFAAGLGDRCTADAQCGENECVCGKGEACRAGLKLGICSKSCSPLAPCNQEVPSVCADLGRANPVAPQDWQRPLCLMACSAGDKCPGELTCQELPSGTDAGWVKACFPPGMVRSTGSSCVDALGNPDHEACASGFCAAMGARGACSTPCTGVAGECPPSAACGDFFSPMPSLCLLRCAVEGTCTSDPWLACEPPGGSGPYNFTVTEPPAPNGYCAPKSCAAPDACGLDGECRAGFCQPRQE